MRKTEKGDNSVIDEKGDNSVMYFENFTKTLSGHLHLRHNL